MNKHASERDGSAHLPAPDIRIVLVGTQHPGNIGAAARAMKTMGLRRLVLVAPHMTHKDVGSAHRRTEPLQQEHADALAMAVCADDVLASAQICDTLEEALADCRFVAGCTARQRQVALPEFAPRDAVGRLLDAASDGAVALVFGPERSGLSNDDLQRCHVTVHIPADPAYSSLNLAAAVQVLSYELRLAMLARVDVAAHEPARSDPPADQAQMEAFFAHLEHMLHAIDFHKGRSPATVQRRLRGLFLRAQPDERELRILRGIFADAERMARLAGQGVA
ncbi:MAG TPA: RNA methyltransferase [Xanthomonadaceae bacterium]|nr:RNA methyltransferase [Xanthomonadaceae bacterium]